MTRCRQQVVKASSSIGRAPVSKTGGWGFDSLLACQTPRKLEVGRQKPKIVGMNVAVNLEPVREAAGSRFERMRLFISEVRNELKRVTWPSQAEVYATTVVVILTSVFFGVYLWGVDLLLTAVIGWIYRTLGAA